MAWELARSVTDGLEQLNPVSLARLLLSDKNKMNLRFIELGNMKQYHLDFPDNLDQY